MSLLHDRARSTGTSPGAGAPTADGQVVFGGLRLEQHPDVLAARPWTTAQSRWAARLAADLPDGPVLELYAGGGQIGLEFVRLARRPIVQVDASPVACSLARRNADANRLGHLVTVRNHPVTVPVRPTTGFTLVLADPPYVPTPDVARYPDDPVLAIDGGPDGLAPLRELLRTLPHYLTATTPVLIQLRGPAQAAELERLLDEQKAVVRVTEVRAYGPDRAVALLTPR